MIEWLIKRQRIVYTYEPDGRVKEKFVYDGNTNTIRYRSSYKDDEEGDWIEMREFTYLPSNPEYGWSEGDFTFREITYFQ
jgi:hypothetical protein